MRIQNGRGGSAVLSSPLDVLGPLEKVSSDAETENFDLMKAARGTVDCIE
jgi:hypothetical protein